MITPSQVLAAARKLAISGSITERIDSFDVAGVFNDETFTQWCEIINSVDFAGLVLALNAVDDPVDWGAAAPPDGLVRISIQKNNTSTVRYFFSAIGFSTLFSDINVTDARVIYIAEAFDEFDTESCKVRRWTLIEPTLEWKFDKNTISPNRLIKDLGSALVPLSVSPYLMEGPSPQSSAVLNVWKKHACRNLFFSLVSEVWVENNAIQISLIGPRTRKIAFDLNEINPHRDFLLLTEVAQWVYGAHRDTEIRHTLFTYELARDWNDQASLSRGFAERAAFALEAAKTSFHAHICNTSKDTLKSLADLRKGLGEEVTKVTNQTKELLSSLWKDFAIAVTALFGRIALSASGKLSDPIAMKAVLYGTAFFLIASISINLFFNSRFLRLSSKNRISWSQKLYGFLSAEDRRILADEPLEQAESLYYRTVYPIILIYVVVAVTLIVLA